MIHKDHIMQSGRLAGMVKRYHTMPMIQQQTNAEHTWQVMRIWVQCFGCISSDVAEWLIWHDAGELQTGDLPYPMKSENPIIGHAIRLREHQAVQNMGGHAITPDEYDLERAKICELIEMMEHCQIEVMMGNQLADALIPSLRLDTENRISRQLKDYDEINVRRYMLINSWMETKDE